MSSNACTKEEWKISIQKAQAGDKEERDAVVEANIGLVYMVIKRFYGRGCETEDLFQIGVIGLLKAIDKFDLGKDLSFSTYAVPMIIGEIRRFLRDDGMIHVQDQDASLQILRLPGDAGKIPGDADTKRPHF